jgi:hypothetical protein
VDLVDDQQADFKLSGKCADAVPQRRDARAVSEYTTHCHQQFFVQIAFAWIRPNSKIPVFNCSPTLAKISTFHLWGS